MKKFKIVIFFLSFVPKRKQENDAIASVRGSVSGFKEGVI